MSLVNAFERLSIEPCALSVATFEEAMTHGPRLDTITHLTIATLTQRDFGILAAKICSVRVLIIGLDAATSYTPPINLQALAHCPYLEDLTIHGVAQEVLHRIEAFSVPSRICLKSLQFRHVELRGAFFFSAIEFATLERLSIDDCDISWGYSSGQLECLKMLTHMRVRGSHNPRIKSDIFALRLFNAQITFDVPESYQERRDYKNVVSLDRGITFCEEVLSADFLNELDQAARCEDNDWCGVYVECLRPYPVPFLRANFVRCPDGRVRIATRNPRNHYDVLNWWKYVRDHVSAVVMVRECEAPCFPLEVGDELDVGEGIRVECVKVTKEDGWCVREFKIDNKIIYHIQIDWPDGKGIDEQLLVRFTLRVQELEALHKDAQTLVHCKAGQGRTGTFLAVLIMKLLIEQALREGKKPEELRIDWPLFYQGLREQRRKLVQNKCQMQTVYKASRLHLHTMSRQGRGEKEGLANLQLEERDI